jgi:hypothetical protein
MPPPPLRTILYTVPKIEAYFRAPHFAGIAVS